MSRNHLARAGVIAAAVAAVTLAVAAPASAHVTVNANGATKGGYTKVTFRVPNETDSTDTTKLEVNLPADTPIASVALKPVAGWTATTVKTKLSTPIKSDDGDITDAITQITWTAQAGAAIKPGQFQEFDVSLGPLPDKDQLVFKALQTYSDGAIVRWIDEPAAGAEGEHPAPVLKLAAAPAQGGTAASVAPAPAPVATSGSTSQGDGNGTPYAILGILVALAALATALLAYRRAGATRHDAASAPSAERVSSSSSS